MLASMSTRARQSSTTTRAGTAPKWTPRDFHPTTQSVGLLTMTITSNSIHLPGKKEGLFRIYGSRDITDMNDKYCLHRFHRAVFVIGICTVDYCHSSEVPGQVAERFVIVLLTIHFDETTEEFKSGHPEQCPEILWSTCRSQNQGLLIC